MSLYLLSDLLISQLLIFPSQWMDGKKVYLNDPKVTNTVTKRLQEEVASFKILYH